MGRLSEGRAIGFMVTTATLTTIIVFSSVLVGGEMRFMLYQLALPVVSALLASLGTAIIFIRLLFTDAGFQPSQRGCGSSSGSH